jgi:hypothetical protein
MNRLLFLSLLLFSLAGCKKIKENIQEKKVLDFITSGQWRVASFEKGGVNYASDFTGYQFQFKKNDAVDALKNGVVEKTGTWLADANNYTITSTFPADASYPLQLLNGVWLIIDGDETYVVATKTVNGNLETLRLDKV